MIDPRKKNSVQLFVFAGIQGELLKYGLEIISSCISSKYHRLDTLILASKYFFFFKIKCVDFIILKFCGLVLSDKSF